MIDAGLNSRTRRGLLSRLPATPGVQHDDEIGAAWIRRRGGAIQSEVAEMQSAVCGPSRLGHATVALDCKGAGEEWRPEEKCKNHP